MRPRPRPELGDLAPYKTSDVESGRVFLHANENPFPPPDEILDEIFTLARSRALNRYPSPEDANALTSELASYAGVDPSWVFVGDGGNEVLLQACLAYGGPGRTAMVFEPTYRMHYRQARMAGTSVIEARRESDFGIDVLAAVETIEAQQPDVIFLCTPNNPTGTITPPDDIRAIVEAAPGLVIIDEAYYEFCGNTLVGDLDEMRNVLVVRTMSKAFRLASVRLGYGIAHPDLLEEMRRVKMPYGQSAFTIAAATVALRRRDVLLEAVPQLIAERERLAAALAGHAEVFASGANFVLFRHPKAQELQDALVAKEIVIRDFRHLPGCEGCLRITAGSPDENGEFIDVLNTVSH